MLSVLLLLACSAEPAPVSNFFPRGCRDRSCWTRVSGRGGGSSGPGGPSWQVISTLDFLATGPAIEPVIDGEADDWFYAVPNLDGGNTWEVYDDGGVVMSTTQGTGTAFGTVLGQRAMLDVTDTSHPFTSDARLRAGFLVDHTIMCAGYCTTRGNATEQVLFDQYDGVHEVTMYGQGSALRYSNDGTSHFAASDTNFGQPIDGVSIFWGRQSGSTLCAGVIDPVSETNCITHAPPLAMVSGHLDWGAFPSPFTGNACRGNLLFCRGWLSAKSDAYLMGRSWKFYGISKPEWMLNAGYGVAQLVGHEDPNTGRIDVLHSHSTIIDPRVGLVTARAFTNYSEHPTDVSALTAIGSATVDGNIAGGALAQWKNTTPAGRVWNQDGGTQGVIIATLSGLDGGQSGWYSLAASLFRGDAGTTTDKARVAFKWTGRFDGGNADNDGGCNIAGLADTSFMQPAGTGCYAYFYNLSALEGDLLVGNAAGTTGSIFVSEVQMTNSQDLTQPTVTAAVGGVSIGLGFVAADAGMVPHGATAVGGGGVELVIMFPNDLPNVVNADPRAYSAFFEDAFASAAPNHIITHNYGSQPSGLALLALMYGPSFLTDNYLLTPFSIPGRLWYGIGIKWEANGTQCRAHSYANVCPDQGTPSVNCFATTEINTGVWGECPNAMDTMYFGNRYDNSDNAHVNFAVMRVYQQTAAAP